MSGGYAMGLSAEMDFLGYLIIFSYEATRRLCLFFLLYKPPIAPLSVFFFPYATSCTLNHTIG